MCGSSGHQVSQSEADFYKNSSVRFILAQLLYYTKIENYFFVVYFLFIFRGYLKIIIMIIKCAF